MRIGTYLCATLLCAGIVHSALAAGPTPNQVLILYNSNYAADSDGDGVQDSLEVANYYALKRGVPSVNILGLNISPTVLTANGYPNYSQFSSEILLPVIAKLNTLGPSSIDIILLSYGLPFGAGTMSTSPPTVFSIDGTLAAPTYWPSSGPPYPALNPYFDPNPTFHPAMSQFDHSISLSGSPIYMVNRLDGPGGVIGAMELIDQALYADKFLSGANNTYNGNIYIDCENRALSALYTDSWLSQQAYVRNGDTGSYDGIDENTAFAEHYLPGTPFPMKWERSSNLIGQPGTLFQDGTSATSAPRALFYGGWYSFSTYEDVYEWLPGSVASDFDSVDLYLSAIRDPNSLSFGPQALKHGASAYLGGIQEPFADGHQRPNVAIYYLLNGYSFAEASMLATPKLGWVNINIGDPLYVPMGPKTPLIDTNSPSILSGSLKAKTTPESGLTIQFTVDDTAGPKVARAAVDFGPTTAYGSTVSPEGFWKRHNIPLTANLISGQTLHYRIRLMDPAGNPPLVTGDQTVLVPTEAPYLGTPAAIPGTIEAENFDEGGEGIAYHDIDTANVDGTSFRPGTGVDIAAGAQGCNDVSPSLCLDHIGAGEWLKYSINVTAAATYNLQIRYLNPSTDQPSTAHVEFDGADLTGPISILNNSGTWQTAAPSVGIPLSAGTHVMRFVVDNNGTTSTTYATFGTLVNWFQLTATGPPPPPTAPIISPQPSGQTVTVGQTATFSVTASGTAPLSYQWSKNGAAISGATTASYTTPATTMADNGAQFTVVVGNMAGSATSLPATLTVTALSVPPTISPQPSNQAVIVGQTATFSVTATGTAPLSYQWSKNGAAISGATSASYTTAATTIGDNGTQFTVVVTNSLGTATSLPATLSVTTSASAPSIGVQPLPQTVSVGQSATFSVTANGTAPLFYQWFKNDVAINGATSSSYLTPPTTLADNGAPFKVIVSNSLGGVTSPAVILTVNGSVPATNQAHFLDQTVPGTMTAGQTYTVSVTMQNMGTSTWTENSKFRLGAQYPQENNRIWSLPIVDPAAPGDRVYLTAGETIPPNAQKKFTFTATAPSTPGTYNFEWRMVQEWVEWFGDISANIAVVVIAPAHPSKPIASFTVSTTSGMAPLPVHFDASGSRATQVGTALQQYAWNFGDGQIGTGVQIDHTYLASGNYTAQLQLYDTIGSSAAATSSILVSAGNVASIPPPILSLPTTLPLDSIISVNYPPGYAVERFDWSFVPTISASSLKGLSTGQASSINYSSLGVQADLSLVPLVPGPYTVSVRAIDAFGIPTASAQATVNFVALEASGNQRVFPNPWRADSDRGVDITFDHLNPGSSIDIFTLSGRYVHRIINTLDRASWDRRDESGRYVASGLYLYLIRDPSGAVAKGKLVLIR